jgi:hypothetical protein
MDAWFVLSLFKGQRTKKSVGLRQALPSNNLKGLCHHMGNFLRFIKLNQYFFYMRLWFLNFLVGLSRKILNTKIFIASNENTYEF